MKRKILVTGYPGWLGNRLVDQLVQLVDYDIRCLVLRKFVSIKGNKKIEVVLGDIKEYYSCLEATKDVDIVIHAAGIIHAKPKTIMDINYKGTKNMLKASKVNGVKNFIYISSNSAVGHTKKKILMTETTPRRPYMTYGKSKFLAEELVNGYSLDEAFKTIILRPCWFYGIGQPTRQTKLFNMIKKGRPIIVGNGLNLRSMTYVDTLVGFIMCAIDRPKLNGKTYWVADERPYTMNEVYETIYNNIKPINPYKPIRLPSWISALGRNLDKFFQRIGVYVQIAHVTGESTQNIACDISRAIKDLGYTPLVSLEEGIKNSIKWCKDNKQL